MAHDGMAWLAAAGLWVVAGTAAGAEAGDRAAVLAELGRLELAAAGTNAAMVADQSGPALAGAERLAVGAGDVGVVAAVIRYQLAVGAQDPGAALVLGRVLWERGDAVFAALKTLPAERQLAALSYIEFGWGKASAGVTTNNPRVRVRTAQLTKLRADLRKALGVRPAEPEVPEVPGKKSRGKAVRGGF